MGTDKCCALATAYQPIVSTTGGSSKNSSQGCTCTRSDVCTLYASESLTSGLAAEVLSRCTSSCRDCTCTAPDIRTSSICGFVSSFDLHCCRNAEANPWLSMWISGKSILQFDLHNRPTLGSKLLLFSCLHVASALLVPPGGMNTASTIRCSGDRASRALLLSAARGK